MASPQLARRYARALFSLGEQAGAAAAMSDQVDTLTDEILGSDALRRVLLTPLHPRSERRGVIGEVCERLGLSREVRAFAMIIVDENRIGALAEIRDALREQVEVAAGRIVARVRSARELGSDELEQVRAALARRTGREISIQAEVDPDLIGGVVARVGDLLLDGSVKTQLQALRESLRRGSA